MSLNRILTVAVSAFLLHTSLVTHAAIEVGTAVGSNADLADLDDIVSANDIAQTEFVGSSSENSRRAELFNGVTGNTDSPVIVSPLT